MFVMRSAWNSVRMFTLMICRSDSKLGHMLSITRSVGQIIEKPCDLCRGHIFHVIYMKIWVCIAMISRSGSKLGHMNSKTKSLCQIIEKTTSYSVQNRLMWEQVSNSGPSWSSCLFWSFQKNLEIGSNFDCDCFKKINNRHKKEQQKDRNWFFVCVIAIVNGCWFTEEGK